LSNADEKVFGTRRCCKKKKFVKACCLKIVAISVEMFAVFLFGHKIYGPQRGYCVNNKKNLRH